ncbi:uncharacterized mitochondrial protein-like protein [Tanacetum coccineum]
MLPPHPTLHIGAYHKHGLPLWGGGGGGRRGVAAGALGGVHGDDDDGEDGVWLVGLVTAGGGGVGVWFRWWAWLRKAKKSVKLMMEKLFRMELELMLFWSTVKVKTINGEVQLHALVDGKKIIITKASVRRDLQLADEEGVDSLVAKAERWPFLKWVSLQYHNTKWPMHLTYIVKEWKYTNVGAIGHLKGVAVGTAKKLWICSLRTRKRLRRSFSKTIKATKVSRIVTVWWPADRDYYEGVVDSFDCSKKKHKILYDDGDEDVLEPRLRKWMIYQDVSDTPEFGFAAALAILITRASQSRQHDTLVRLPMDIRFKIDLGKSVGDLTSHLSQSLFDIGSGRISIVTLNTFRYHSNVLAIPQG